MHAWLYRRSSYWLYWYAIFSPNLNTVFMLFYRLGCLYWQPLRRFVSLHKFIFSFELKFNSQRHLHWWSCAIHNPSMYVQAWLYWQCRNWLYWYVVVYSCQVCFHALFSDLDACVSSPCGGLFLVLSLCVASKCMMFTANAICTDEAAPSIIRQCACKLGYTGNAVIGCTGMSSFTIVRIVLMLCF